MIAFEVRDHNSEEVLDVFQASLMPRAGEALAQGNGRFFRVIEVVHPIDTLAAHFEGPEARPVLYVKPLPYRTAV